MICKENVFIAEQKKLHNVLTPKRRVKRNKDGFSVDLRTLKHHADLAKDEFFLHLHMQASRITSATLI